jgi:VWFA-related protein
MYRFSRRSFFFASAGALLAQDSTFTADVNVVTVLASVLDSDGRIVKDLTRGDFTLAEDGVPQNIRYFSRESDLPLTVGLLIDTSRSQLDVMEPERNASYKFLDQVLRPDKDQAFVAHFDTRVEVVQGFTSSRQELRAALDQLEVPVEVATLLYEAIRQTSENMMRPRQGRKAFILLSDGVSFRDKTSIGTAIEYAQRADTIIYSILFAEHPEAHRPARTAIHAIVSGHGRSAMQRLARETGGAYFEISADHTIEDAYAQIEDELRNQYSLGYTPARSDKSAGYRKIKLTVNRPGLVVQARDGYYAN